MELIEALKETYGYSVPIFLKDLRFGHKSKTAIRKELSRAAIRGEICRKSSGVYYLSEDKEIPSTISFEEIVEKKFVKDDYGFPGLNLDVYGYYTGLAFLNQIGISQQVPAVLEIVTNKTSCKRYYCACGFKALLRKGKIQINRFNYKALQFFDMFYLLSDEEVKKYSSIIYSYIEKNLSSDDFEKYVGLYDGRVLKLIVEGGFLRAFRHN